MLSGAGIRALLLDIEGTVTPISFVHEVLFPFARGRVRHYLGVNFRSHDIAADLAQLYAEHASDVREGREPPVLIDTSDQGAIDSLASYVLWLMDRDRKSPGLKSLQGKIWEQGYRDGALVAPLYPDVLPAVENARRAGLKIAIFSSGSVLAQRLLFSHTDAGDVTGLIDHYFDTTTGAKSASESYVRISRALDLVPAEVLFISDVTAELDAARAAGMRTWLCVRPGNPAQPGGEHGIIESFDRLTWLK